MPFATLEELDHLNGILAAMEQQLQFLQRRSHLTAEANWICECGCALKRVLRGQPKHEDDRIEYLLVCRNRHCPQYGRSYEEPALSRVTIREIPSQHEASA
jgi:hypothetical protein